VAFVRTDVTEERIAYITKVRTISELLTLAVTSALQLLVTANFIPISLILLTLIMEAIRSTETSIPTRTTWYHIPEDDILRSPEWLPQNGFIAIHTYE
jgi:hypothetical protein